MNPGMIRKLQQMQRDLEKTQKEINETEFKSSKGPVTVTVRGTKEIVEVKIDEEFEYDGAEDGELLGAMIVAASNEAYKEIEKITEEKMSKYQALLGGMKSMF